jgi:hypothetical protein
MRVDCTYTFHCDTDGCDVTAVDYHSDVNAQRLPHPRTPAGWTPIGLLLFCHRHTLMLQVDGQETALPPSPPEGA